MNETNENDTDIWLAEIADVTPLHPAIVTPPPPVTPPPRAKISSPPPSPALRPVRYPLYDRSPPTITLSGFDASLFRQLKLHRHPITHKLDMHDMSVALAYSHLYAFLRDAWHAETKVALVITGKGSTGQIGELKRNLPRWCVEPTFQPMVVAVRESLPHHGGAGAYYIQIRNKQKS